MASNTANLKLGTHRNSPRLWLEGSKLAAAGFSKGDAFEIREAIDATGTARGLIVLKTTDGDRTTSGRTRNGKSLPIIDAHSQDWTRFFTSGRIEVEYHAGRILIADAAYASQWASDGISAGEVA